MRYNNEMTSINIEQPQEHRLLIIVTSRGDLVTGKRLGGRYYAIIEDQNEYLPSIRFWVYAPRGITLNGTV